MCGGFSRYLVDYMDLRYARVAWIATDPGVDGINSCRLDTLEGVTRIPTAGSHITDLVHCNYLVRLGNKRMVIALFYSATRC